MTIEELNKQVELIAKLRLEEEQASQVKKVATNILEQAEARMLEMLQEAGLTSYRDPIGRQVVLAFRTSVQTPKTDEAKAQFYGWLKEKGMYDAMISVNSQKLNALYKSELEEARDRGDQDFAIPGITEVKIAPQLSFRRG